MLNTHCLIGSSLFVLFLFSTALAQENRAPIDNPREAVAPIPAAPLVTAAATAKRVRFVSPGAVVQLRQTATIKTITVDVPANGFLVLFGSMFGASETTGGGLPHTSFGTLQFFDETSNTTFASAMFSDNIGESTHAIQSVLPVSAGTRTISLKVKADSDSGDLVFYYSNPNTFVAMFFPVRY